MQSSKKLYEEFHRNIYSQKRIIKNDNFTYRNITSLIDRYFVRKAKVLDIGCGAGAISFYLVKKGHQVDGIDISKNAILNCSKNSKILNLKNVRFEVVNFPNQRWKKKYKYIICSEVLEHLKDDKKALRKIFYHLEKEGIGIISCPSINAPLFKLGQANEFDKTVGHLRRYSLNELSQLCKKTGFKIVATKKTEGIVRNFLFLNPIAGKLVKIINFFPFISNVVTIMDDISLKLFGESNVFVVIKKP